MEQLDYLNNKLGDIIYGMPILESEEVIYKETRLHELNSIINSTTYSKLGRKVCCSYSNIKNHFLVWFLRVRSPEHFKSFSEKLKSEYTRILTGFVFPKFCCRNGYLYMEQLDYLNNKLGVFPNRT